MAHHKRRPLRTVAPLVIVLAVAAAPCFGAPSASSPDESPFSSNPTVVHGGEHLGWEETVTDGSGGVGFRYLVYVDGKSTPLLDAKCQPSGNGNFGCKAELPSMTAGPHRLRLSTVRQSPGPTESSLSAPLDILAKPSNSLARAARAVATQSVAAQSSASPAAATARVAEQTLMSGLDAPSTLAVTPDGRVFLVERTGNVRVWLNGAGEFPVAAHIANAAQQGSGGLFGIAIDPDFANNHRLYVAYTNSAPDGTLENRIVRFRELNNSLGEAAVIFVDPVTTLPSAAPRIAFGPDGKLYAAFPGTSASSADYTGKILRLNADGSTPRDNPAGNPIFAGREGTVFAFAWQPSMQEFWELYRNPQGELVLGVKAPDGGSVAPVGLLASAHDPSGIAFYGSVASAPFPRDLLVATESGEQIIHLTLGAGDPNALVSAEDLPAGFGRISAITVTPDGSLYFTTNNRSTGAGAPGDDRLILVSRPH